MLAICVGLNATWPRAVRSEWNRDRLYREMLAGNDKERIAAAEALVAAGGREQLMKALQSDSASIRTVAASALYDIWMTQEGEEAAFLLQVAGNSLEHKNLKGALSHLNRLTSTHPFFAEGWNRRATLLWQLGLVEKALADCRKVVLLNPDHFAAWQGMGTCHLRLGNYEPAVKAFEQAAKLMPYDRTVQRNLRLSQEMLQREKKRPAPTRAPEPVGEAV